VLDQEKMVYSPWNVHEYLVLRVYVHPDIVTEDISSELESLKAKGCEIVEQTQFDGDKLVEDFPALIASAKDRLEQMRREAHLEELRQSLLKELDTEEKLQEVMDVLAAKKDALAKGG